MPDARFQWPGQRVEDPAHERVAAFLVMDIQGSPDWAEQLAVKLAEVKSGAALSWERIGNAYRLLLTGEGALIEDLVDPASRPERVSLDEFEAAVRAWRAR